MSKRTIDKGASPLADTGETPVPRDETKDLSVPTVAHILFGVPVPDEGIQDLTNAIDAVHGKAIGYFSENAALAKRVLEVVAREQVDTRQALTSALRSTAPELVLITDSYDNAKGIYRSRLVPSDEEELERRSRIKRKNIAKKNLQEAIANCYGMNFEELLAYLDLNHYPYHLVNEVNPKESIHISTVDNNLSDTYVFPNAGCILYLGDVRKREADSESLIKIRIIRFNENGCFKNPESSMGRPRLKTDN